MSLRACGLAQGIDIRPASAGGSILPGDMLFVRAGFVEVYHSKPADERTALALRPHVHGPNDPQRWAGLEQEDAVVDWLHDCYFAAVAGDSPTFEAWPSQKEMCLHEYILALWGEFFAFLLFSFPLSPHLFFSVLYLVVIYDDRSRMRDGIDWQ